MTSSNTCEAVRELMLEAELAELRDPASAIGQHIASCEKCRRIANVLLADHASLDGGLDQLRPSRAEAKAARRWLRWTPLPLAAAAALALLLTRHEQQAIPEPTMLARLMLPPDPEVTPPAGKQAVVMEKNNLTVVWLY